MQRVGEKGGGRRKKGKEGEKEKRKGKKEKGKREKEKWRERKRERAVGGIRGGGRPCARCGVRPVSDEHAEREKGKGDRTAIGTGVETADCRDMILGDWELVRKIILE